MDEACWREGGVCVSVLSLACRGWGGWLLLGEATSLMAPRVAFASCIEKQWIKRCETTPKPTSTPSRHRPRIPPASLRAKSRGGQKSGVGGMRRQAQGMGSG